MKKIFILLFLIFKIPLLSAQVGNNLETILSSKEEKKFNVKLKKIDNKKYILSFKNLSKKDIYISTNESNNYDMSTEEHAYVYFGQNVYILGNINDFDLLRIKSGEEINKEYISKEIELDVIISIIFKNRFIKKNKDNYYISSQNYFDKLKTYTYRVEN